MARPRKRNGWGAEGVGGGGVAGGAMGRKKGWNRGMEKEDAGIVKMRRCGRRAFLATGLGGAGEMREGGCV